MKDIAGLVNFAMSPNPTINNSIVKLTLDHLSDIQVSVYDLTGKLVTQSNMINSSNFEYEIQLADMPNAAYIVKINVDNQTITRRLVKQ